MYCGQCGSSLRETVKFCSVCGTFVPRVADLSLPPQQKKNDLTNVAIRLKVYLAIVAVLILLLWFRAIQQGKQGAQPKSATSSIVEEIDSPRAKERVASERNSLNKLGESVPSSVAVEIDVPRIALASRSKVEKVLGSPLDSVPSLDMAGYSWGFVAYKNGRLDQIDYAYKVRPSSVKEALEKVGLKQVSTPQKGPFSYYWNSSTQPFICCGLEFDNIVISSDFSGISVGVLRRNRKNKGGLRAAKSLN